MVIYFNCDPVPIVLHIIGRFVRYPVGDLVSADGDQGEGIVFDLPVDYLVTIICSTGFGTVFLDSILVFDLPGILRSMRVSGNRFD